MPKQHYKITPAVGKKMLAEYVDDINVTCSSLARKYDLDKSTVYAEAERKKWKLRRQEHQLKLFNEENKKLDALAKQYVELWDEEMLQMLATTKDKVRELLDAEDINVNVLKRIAEIINILNDVQRKITNRDIQRIESINAYKVDELRDLILNNE